MDGCRKSFDKPVDIADDTVCLMRITETKCQMKLMLVTYFLAATSAFSGDLWFSQMENGDRVEVTEHSTGCFHNKTSFYEIRKDKAAYSFREYAITWGKSSPPTIIEKKIIGDIIVTRKDIENLDGLLKYYRGEKLSSSTSQVSLLVEYYEPGGLVKVEKLQDGSGGLELGVRKDVVTFFALTQRFPVK